MELRTEVDSTRDLLAGEVQHRNAASEDASSPQKPRSAEIADGQPQWDPQNYKAAIATTTGEDFSKQLVSICNRTKDSVFDKAMVSRLMVGKYKTKLKEQVLMKDAVALHLYSTLMGRLKPGTIFDLGTCGGGSALWFSAQAKLLGMDTQVVTCDIEDMRSQECKKLMEEAGNITFLLGDLNDGKSLFAKLQEQGAELPKPWLVAEDCHLDTEVILTCFEGQLAVNDYIIFEDTHPFHPDNSNVHAEVEDFENNYVCGTFADEKYALMEKAIKARGDEFAVDTSIQDLYGYNGATFVNSVFVKQQ